MNEVLVFGTSVPALVAALDLAEIGIRVHLVPVECEAPKCGVRDPEGTVAKLLDRIASPIAPGGAPFAAVEAETHAPARALVRAKNGEWAAQPVPEVWGIPAVAISGDSVVALGTGASFRAYLDRLKPLLTIGKQPNLGRLIDSRMGAGVRQLLADPLVRECFGEDASEVEVALAAPGFNESLTIAGSLSGAVLRYVDRFVARETRIEPSGGWAALVAAMFERLELYGTVRLEQAVSGIDRVEGGSEWDVRFADGSTSRYAAVIAGNRADLPFEGAALADVPAAALPRTRVYAEIGIDSVPSAEDAQGALVSGSIEVVERDGGERWTVRTREGAVGGAVALLSGPAMGGEAPYLEPSEFVSLVERCGLSAVDAPRSWREAAPFSTHAQRTAAEEAAAKWSSAFESVLVLGETEHGADLGAAVREAEAHAVQLRRRIAGIAD